MLLLEEKNPREDFGIRYQVPWPSVSSAIVHSTVQTKAKKRHSGVNGGGEAETRRRFVAEGFMQGAERKERASPTFEVREMDSESTGRYHRVNCEGSDDDSRIYHCLTDGAFCVKESPQSSNVVFDNRLCGRDNVEEQEIMKQNGENSEGNPQEEANFGEKNGEINSEYASVRTNESDNCHMICRNIETVEIPDSIEKHRLGKIGQEILAHKETDEGEDLCGRCNTSFKNVSALREAKNGPSDAELCAKQSKNYSVEDILALRFVNVQEQQKRWSCIYEGLGSVVRELDEISAASEQPKKARKNVDRRQRMKKKKNKEVVVEVACSEISHINAAVSGDTSIEIIGKDHKDMDLVDCDCAGSITADDNCTSVKFAGDECEDSDDECDSIQRPAFSVQGEPDFESGPPQDGLEYLRRVRWEAMQIPKVKVARLDKSKLRVEQTPYMPHIPDIADCPIHLQPSKQWVDTFLTDFSELRQALSQLQNSNSKPSSSGKNVLCKQDGELKLSSKMPSLSVILGLDVVSRATVLRNHVRSLEDAKELSRGDSEWAFALFLALDEPVGADTAAAIRCLLRKCACLRASKTVHDDEVVMLNIIITIAGKYFGQSEK